MHHIARPSCCLLEAGGAEPESLHGQGAKDIMTPEGILEVQLLDASHVPSMDWIGSSDPFVKHAASFMPPPIPSYAQGCSCTKSAFGCIAHICSPRHVSQPHLLDMIN